MKLIYKTIIPIILLIAVIMVGIAYFSRTALEHALIEQEFDRIQIVVERALLPETEHHDESVEEEVHTEAEEGHSHAESTESEAESILQPEDFKYPDSELSNRAFRRYIEEFKDPTASEINIIAGSKIIASNNDQRVGANLDPKASDVLQGQAFYFITGSNGDKVMVSYVPFVFDNVVVGAVEIKSNLSHVLEPINEEMDQIILRLILSGIVALSVIFYIVRRFIIRPIQYLESQAEQIGAGNLSAKIVVPTSDELGTLAQFFEKMRIKLKSAFDTEQAKLIASIQSLQFGFIIIDTDKNILMWNKAATDVLGAAKNKGGFGLLTSYFGAKYDIAEAYEKCLSRKAAVISEEIDTQKKFYKVSMFPIIAEKVVGAVVIIDDVTTATLLERNKQEFFAVASHELRTPLTSIHGNMGMIKDYWDRLEDKEILEMVEQAHQSTKRLIKIVNDFLDASRLEHDKVLAIMEEVDVTQIISEVVKEMMALVKSKGLRLVYKPNPKLPKAKADRARLKQVVYNILGNAVNYTKEGDVTVETQIEGDFIRVLVSDTGIGITPQNQRLLFKKFQQAGKQVLAREVNVGTGMGLYISKLLVDAMKGKIGLANSSSKGSVFYFTIPIAKK